MNDELEQLRAERDALKGKLWNAEERVYDYQREVERRDELLRGANEDRKAAEARLERALGALRSVEGLQLECVRDGRGCPAEGCDCDSCETIREVCAALADDAPKGPGHE